MSSLYKKYLRLLDKWPIDEFKSNDLGQHLREQIKIAFSKGDNSQIQDKEKCERYYKSLDRLASNYYADKYPCTFKTTATGLKPEHCTLALSPKFQELLQEKKLGFIGNIKLRLTNFFKSSKSTTDDNK